jgi:hypothetical protein
MLVVMESKEKSDL